MKFSLMVARFPGGGVECTECVDWLMQSVVKLSKNPRVEQPVRGYSRSDTPITMVRNDAVHAAQRLGVDLLLMVDNDMAPDYYVGDDPTARPFLDVALEHFEKTWSNGPSVIAAPYCGPPP